MHLGLLLIKVNDLRSLKLNPIFLSIMTSRKKHIPIGLMVIAIVAIAFFQGYWLYKTFGDEKQTLSIRTNVLFRESIFESQAARFNMDTSGTIKIGNKVDAIRVISNVKQRMHVVDSAEPGEKRIFLTLKNRARNDDTLLSKQPDSVFDVNLQNFPQRRTFNRSIKGDVFYDVLQGVDMVQDSLTIPDVSRRLTAALQKEGIKIPFLINRIEIKPGERVRQENLESSNQVLIGFSRPLIFRLDLQQTGSYLFKKILPQIVVSLLLVALTTISFIVLFRNLVRQRKLTQLKNDFISNITHELKTPIATVSVAVEAMKSFNALDDPKRTQEYLSISANELQRLSLLVDKVLKLSMFEKQEIELKNEAFDLKQLIEEVVASMRLQFEKYHAIIKLDLPDTPIALTADRLHITSVIYNLLDNALKYSKGNPVIRIGVKDNSDELEFVVEDNGAGIPNEYKEKVFDKFFRVPTGDHHNVKGYGLGLSYVAYVIQRHHGRISVETQAGTGSTFTVILPK
jgi:two-component system phosphate regulon sensor histidine kinase PhoR